MTASWFYIFVVILFAIGSAPLRAVSHAGAEPSPMPDSSSSDSNDSASQPIQNPSVQEFYDLLKDYRKGDPESDKKLKETLEKLGLTGSDLKELEKLAAEASDEKLKEFKSESGSKPFTAAPKDFSKQIQKLFTKKNETKTPSSSEKKEEGKPEESPQSKPEVIKGPLSVQKDGSIKIEDAKAFEKILNSQNRHADQALKDVGLGQILDPNRKRPLQIGDSLVMPKDEKGNYQVLDAKETEAWRSTQEQNLKDLARVTEAGVSFPETKDPSTGAVSRSLKVDDPASFLPKLRSDPELIKAMDRQFEGLGTKILIQAAHEDAVAATTTPVDQRVKYLPWMQKASFEAYKKANQGIAPDITDPVATEIRGALTGLASLRQTEKMVQQTGASLTAEQKLKLEEAKALLTDQIGRATEGDRLTQEFRDSYREGLASENALETYQDLYRKYREEHPEQNLPKADVVTRLNLQNRVTRDLNDLINGKSHFGDLNAIIKEAARVSATGYIDISNGIKWSNENHAVKILDAIHKGLMNDARALDNAGVAPDLAKKIRNLSGELGNIHATLMNKNADEYAAKVKREIGFAILSVASLGAGQLIAMSARAGQVAQAAQVGQKAYQSFHLAETSLFTLKEGAKYAFRNATIGGMVGGGLYTGDAVAKYIDDSRKIAADPNRKGETAKFDFSLKGLGVETFKGSAIGGLLGFSPVAAEAAGAYFTVTSIRAGTEQWQNKDYAQAITNIFGGQVVVPWAVHKINSHGGTKSAETQKAETPVSKLIEVAAKPTENFGKTASKPAVWSERPALTKDQLREISTRRNNRVEELNELASKYEAEGKKETAESTRKQVEDLKLENEAFEHYRKLAETQGSKYEVLASGEEFLAPDPKTGKIEKRGDVDLVVRYDGKPVIVEVKNVAPNKARGITNEQIDKLKTDPIMNAPDSKGVVAEVVIHAPKLAPIQPLADKAIISVDGKVISDTIKRLGTEITIGLKQLEGFIKVSDPVKAIDPQFRSKAEEVAGRKLSDSEARLLQEAHEIGKGDPTQFKGKYSSEVLQEKYTKAVEGLIERGISDRDAHALVKKLMVEGVLGKDGPALKVDETFTAKEAGRLRVGDVVELTSVRDNTRKSMVVGIEKDGIQVMGADGKGRTVYFTDQLKSGKVVRPSEGAISGPVEGRVSSSPKDGKAFQANEVFPAETRAFDKLPMGSKVTFKSLSGNEYEGTYQGLTADKSEVRLKTAEGKDVSLVVDRLALGKIRPPVAEAPKVQAELLVNDIPGVPEGPYAKMLRAQSVYDRSPGFKTREQSKLDSTEARRKSDEFHEKSAKATEIFSDWLAKSGPKEPVGSLLDRMQDSYYQHPRERGELNTNPRGKITREYVKDRFGIRPNEDGHVPLPGITNENGPGFIGPTYAYASSGKPQVRAQYEAAMTSSLKEYATRMTELETMRREGKNAKNSPEYIAKENEAFKAISDFGQVAAHFRPFENGNWGLFGPMVNTMVGRMGYEIRNPGYLDILFQGGKNEGFSAFFADTVRSGKPFYTSDGYNPITGKTVPFADTSTPRGRAQLKQLLMGNAPENFRKPGMAGPRGLPDEQSPRR